MSGTASAGDAAWIRNAGSSPRSGAARILSRIAPGLLAAASGLGLSACGDRGETQVEAAAGAPAPVPPAPNAAAGRSAVGFAPPPHAGVKLVLVPNLPGVTTDDLPVLSRREVEVLAYDGRRLKLRWSGRVRRESAASSKKRQDWIRAGAKDSARPAPPEYEEADVGGTLDFPDFGRSTQFLLPGLWPEGKATMRDAATLWLPAAARKEIAEKRETRVRFSVPASLLSDPAASLLSRAQLAARSRADSEPGAREPEMWTFGGSSVPSTLKLGGRDVDVLVRNAASWFGKYEVLEDETSSLVLSVLPSPPESRFLDVFAPSNVLQTLLGYRVAAVDAPRRRS